MNTGMRLRMNKKGSELGDIFSAFPVGILIVFVMTLFLIITAAAVVFQPGNEGKAAVAQLKESNVLLKTLDINVNGNNEKIIVLDLITRVINEDKKITGDFAVESLKQLLNEKNPCLFLSVHGDGNSYFMMGIDGKGQIRYLPTEVYFRKEAQENLIVALPVTISGKEIFIDNYYGNCLEEQK